MSDKVYFPNFPYGENLYLLYTYFEYDNIPIVFVCKDENNKMYFCLCHDAMFDYSCMIAQIDIETLRDVISDRIAILDVFKGQNFPIIIANYKDNHFSYEETQFSDIPQEELPRADEYLELSLSEQIQAIGEVAKHYSDMIIDSYYKVRIDYENIARLYKTALQDSISLDSDIKIGTALDNIKKQLDYAQHYLVSMRVDLQTYLDTWEQSEINSESFMQEYSSNEVEQYVPHLRDYDISVGYNPDVFNSLIELNVAA